MNNPYDLHSWSKRYREEVLREVQSRDIVRSTRAGGAARSGWARATRIWPSLLSLLGRTEFVE